MPTCACLQSPPVATRQWSLLVLLAAFTLFNVTYWYAQRDSWKRVPSADFHRATLLSHHQVVPSREKTFRWSDVPLELLFWRPTEALLSGYGRLPFPVENVSFLPVAYSVVQRCRNTGPLSHIFFVHSAPGNWAKRRLLRETIGDAFMALKYAWTTVFFVGMSRNLRVQQMVLDEAERYGDLVMLPYMDAYRNLTYKFIYGMKWTMDNCPATRFIVKMDDDIVINLTKLVAYLNLRKYEERLALHCYVWTNMAVERDTKSPWYIPKKMYRKRVFSRYCSGSTVLFDSRVMEALYNASFLVPFMPVDDVYVTGEAAKVASVGHVKLNRFYALFDDKWEEVARGKYMFAQIYRAKNRRRSWDLIMRELKSPTLAFLDYESSSKDGATSQIQTEESASVHEEAVSSFDTKLMMKETRTGPTLHKDIIVPSHDVALVTALANSNAVSFRVVPAVGDRTAYQDKSGVHRTATEAIKKTLHRSEENYRRENPGDAAFILRGQG